MIRLSDFDAIVIGSGPVGMVAALQLSEYYRTAVITDRLPHGDDTLRVESVPAALLALLLDLGIHPAEVGVDRLYESHLSAWETVMPIENAGPATAHLERPALDIALLKRVMATRNIHIMFDRVTPKFFSSLTNSTHNRCRLIDASGRRAISAIKRIQPIQRWASRTFLASIKGRPADLRFMIAALPGGYLYRLGAMQHIVLGVVGNGKILKWSGRELEQFLRKTETDWMLDGLPSIERMYSGKASPASVQWTVGDGPSIRIGDAALARDPLSSQGISCGISEALYAASLNNPKDKSLFSTRQVEQRKSHLQSLSQLIDRCRYRECKGWRIYSEFIGQNIAYDTLNPDIALKHRVILSPTSPHAELT